MTYQNQRLNSTACTCFYISLCLIWFMKLGQLIFFFAISCYWHRAKKKKKKLHKLSLLQKPCLQSLGEIIGSMEEQEYHLLVNLALQQLLSLKQFPSPTVWPTVWLVRGQNQRLYFFKKLLFLCCANYPCFHIWLRIERTLKWYIIPHNGETKRWQFSMLWSFDMAT